jgi:F-type H+-transporting ATPase subunit gamma
MASTQQIRRRIKSVRNTRQITKAMQLVSASKLRRMQEAAQATQAYSKYARELLTHLKRQPEVQGFELYEERPVKKRLIIVISSDLGLAGAYNANVLKRYIGELQKDADQKVVTATIVFGRQGSNTVTRLKDVELAGVYTALPEKPTAADIEAAATIAIGKFEAGEVDAVDVIYTHFVNTVTQQATMQRLLPAGFTEEEVTESIKTAVFEPSAETVLRSVTVRLVKAQLLQSLLESNVSEQAMRMLAMKNATDNASELLDDYTLELNNARQAAITQELAEISGGVEAMK